ncbi:hypothetical protein F5Y17DRAFT_463673 [Xylariaceae sp. FL0594]|nr:hypothetical protein F5Y17DRAFT_463673 [Xylariaceae sp. FL0594]
MTAGQVNLPDTPAPAALRLALLDDIASSPSLVTATDFLPQSPLHGKDGNGSTNSNNGMKRLRVDDHTDLGKGTHDRDIRAAPTDCRDQVAVALDRDRRQYEAKMKLFQDCADAIDKTLQKAGTELYPYAKEFSTFFAGCFGEWLGPKGSKSTILGMLSLVAKIQNIPDVRSMQEISNSIQYERSLILDEMRDTWDTQTPSCRRNAKRA